VKKAILTGSAPKDSILGDRKDDCTENASDTGGNGPGGEDLGYSLPTPIDAISTHNSNTSPDDTPHNRMC
jgi:hypothetical protein